MAFHQTGSPENLEVRACRGHRLIGQIGELLDALSSLAELTDDPEPLRARKGITELCQQAQNSLLFSGNIVLHVSFGLSSTCGKSLYLLTPYAECQQHA